MASLFKRSYTKLDSTTGKRVRRRTAKWYGQYLNADGILERVPLCTDKSASQAMLNQLIVKAQRRRAGISDPSEDELVRPLTEHLDEYQKVLVNRGATELHASQTVTRIRKLFKGCQFVRIPDIDATKITNWLAEQRRLQTRFSLRTSNFYQDAAKSFCRWLQRHRKISRNPLDHLERLNVETDLRHKRRALGSDELARIVQAAAEGPVVESLTGADRAMLYILAAWTGYRRGELASLTLSSFDLTSDPPTVSVKAGYSKRRRLDCVPLHLVVLDLLKSWLTDRGKMARDEPLFQLRCPSGHFRKTAKMMQRDLQAARKQWIEEAETEDEKQRRTESDVLCYCDEGGLYADFHANRHTFISNLARMGVSPKLAQTLARHSDINLTMNVYSHLELADQALAVASLPAPPQSTETSVQRRLALRLAQTPVAAGDRMSPDGNDGKKPSPATEIRKLRNDKTLGIKRHPESVFGKVHLSGLEPETFGSVDRCSIQLS